ncbi:hypothetical protein [Clostridium kluyveri]|uniref:hypothetical protein n=1 Tax=Clostridium kluyveri TaxID=1534 RepID=UPI0018DE7620|nr:hypothetical protein [Clostridium kluyveri]
MMLLPFIFVATVSTPRGETNPGSRIYAPTKPMSLSNYPNPDPDFTAPQVRYGPKTIEKIERMRKGRGPTAKATHEDRNIEDSS